MVTFERMLFDYNEYMHHSGRLAENAYIDGNLFIMNKFLVLIIIMAYIYYLHPIVDEKIMNLKMSETRRINIVVGLNVSLLSYLYLEHEYGFLLVLTIIGAALYIIFTDKRLIRVREFILRFF